MSTTTTQQQGTITIEELELFLADDGSTRSITALDALQEDPNGFRILASELLFEKKRTFDNEPKLAFAQAVDASTNSILIRELARLLRHNGIDIGRNKLFRYLRKNNYLNEKGEENANLPTQWAIDNDWFSVRKSVITHSDGNEYIHQTCRVTGKGQIYFINHFKNAVLGE